VLRCHLQKHHVEVEGNHGQDWNHSVEVALNHGQQLRQHRVKVEPNHGWDRHHLIKVEMNYGEIWSKLYGELMQEKKLSTIMGIQERERSGNKMTLKRVLGCKVPLCNLSSILALYPYRPISLQKSTSHWNGTQFAWWHSGLCGADRTVRNSSIINNKWLHNMWIAEWQQLMHFSM